MADSEMRPIVIDCGSGNCKAGFAGDDIPQTLFPSVVGYKNGENPGSFVGDEAQALREVTSMSHPIEKGVIANWDAMECIWQYIFDKELHVVPKDHPILHSETALNPKPNREKLAQIMYETFDIPALYLCNHSVLATYATGYTTGVAVECGEGVTCVVPVYYGHALYHNIRTLDIAGRDLTGYLAKLMEMWGTSPMTPEVAALMRDIKEKHTSVSLDVRNQEGLMHTQEFYTLPDGREIMIGREKFFCYEPLFRPSILGIESEGLSDMLYSSVAACDPDIRRDLFQSVRLSGGGTMVPGMDDRILHDLGKKHNAYRVKVLAPPERKYTVWIGGSILGSLSTFQKFWVSKNEYDEMGPRILHNYFI